MGVKSTVTLTRAAAETLLRAAIERLDRWSDGRLADVIEAAVDDEYSNFSIRRDGDNEYTFPGDYLNG